MRVLISSPPPWAQSGYGIQAGLTAEALAALGHEVAISAYAGVHEEREWRGIPILSTGGKNYGNGVIAGNYARWNADLLLLVCDPWMTDPGQLAGLHVMAWMPVDCDPLSRMELQWLDRLRDTAASVRPVAMSEFGKKMLAAEGWDAPLVPHAVNLGEFCRFPEAGRAWRKRMGLGDGFVISKVGVSNDDDRKSFEVTLQAFAAFSAKHPDARLYLHTEAQASRAANLAFMAMQLGLKGKVAFADEHKRGADLYTVADMRAIYCGSDVLDAVSKGEGFGVPVIEALACGTPVIGCRNSAMTEKIRPEWGWLITGQRTWARHHNSWWTQPSAADLERAYGKARTSARSMRKAAARAGEAWSFEAMRDAWKLALDSPARPADHAKIFKGAYASGKWGHGSGPGSDPERCRPYVEFIESFARKHVELGGQVLDLGCGDGQLARAIFWPKSIGYHGMDVVLGDDIRTCYLPDADLVLVKDVFQHWPNADIEAMRVRLAGYDHVLVTNTVAEEITGRSLNADIAAGQWRAVDVTRPPFCWPGRELLRWELPGETKQTVLLERS